jgi:hypothetical protein
MTPLRRWFWVGLCALAVCNSGCNLLSLPFFIFGPEPKVEAELKLASADKDKKVRVAVLASSTDLEVRDQLARVDRDLAVLVTKRLNDLCKYNDEKVRAIPSNVVERYKNEHLAGDQPLDLLRVGEDLKVDYVIYLEVTALTLYEKGSSNQLYHGNADVKVSLVNVHKPDDPPEVRYFNREYPTSPISTFDMPNAMAFRQKFLDHVAERISWYFTAHPTDKDYTAE